jgi:long-chain fatty acid transport protein
MLFLVPAAARAGGFATGIFGAELGNPMTDDLSAIYFNPAGISLLPGTRLTINGMIGYRSGSYDRPVEAIDHVLAPGAKGSGTPQDAIGANSGHASFLNAQYLPFIAAASDLGIKNFAVALGFYVPFGGSLAWDKSSGWQGNNTYPGAWDSPARWGMIDGDIRSYYFTAAAAYNIARAHLSLGVSGNVVYNTITTLRGLSANGSDDLVSSNGGILEGRGLIDVSNVTGSVGAGAIWTPDPHVTIGVSYQSQPGFGRQTLTGTMHTRIGQQQEIVQQVDFQQSMPDALRGGVTVRVAQPVELRAWVEWMRWSVFDKQCVLDQSNAKRNCALTSTGAIDPTSGAGVILAIPRNWTDGLNLHLSSTIHLASWAELIAGLAYDSNVVPDSTLDTAFLDQNKIIANVGLRVFLLQRKLVLYPSWMQVFYLPRTTPNPARDANGQRVAPSPPSLSPSGAGSYSESAGLFGLSLEYRFR